MNITLEDVKKASKDYEEALNGGAKPVQIVATLLPHDEGLEWSVSCYNIPGTDKEIILAFTAVIKTSIEKAINPEAFGLRD